MPHFYNANPPMPRHAALKEIPSTHADGIAAAPGHQSQAPRSLPRTHSRHTTPAPRAPPALRKASSPQLPH